MSLQLSRSHTNLAFESWRLGGSASVIRGQPETTGLPGVVAVGGGDAPDLLHTRAAALHNHLAESGDRRFVFLAAAGGGAALHEVAAGCRLRLVADLPAPPAASDTAAQPQLAEPPLECSLAVLAGPEGAEGAGPLQLLASCGRGDLRLISVDPQGAASTSAVAYPLRPAPPLAGVRPFVLQAAYGTPAGEIRCVLWAAASPQGVAPGASHGQLTAWHAELRALTLTHTPGEGLAVTAANLLQRSVYPPHAVLAHPSEDAFLVAAALPEEDEEEPMAGAAAGGAGPPGAAAGAGAAQPMEEDDDGDVSPRTLEQAAARLAQYTSAQEVGDLPQQRWTDVYHEAGPDGLGAMGDEPPLCLRVYQAVPAGTATPAREGETEAAGSGPHSVAWQCTWSMNGGPHKLLAAQVETGLRRLTLGLSDDVDCAVVYVTLAPGSTKAEVAHVATVPALAYVVAGKTQRRHLLLGPQGSAVAAVLVESQRYLYVYHAVAGAQAAHGTQEVVDMQLPPGESILGARLVGCEAGAPLSLLLLSQQQLQAYELAG